MKGIGNRCQLIWIACFVAACGGRRSSEPDVATSADAPPLAVAEPPPLAPIPRPEPSRPRLQLTLRSTPPGAAASVDGRLVGTTPIRVELLDDGRAHDFNFVLAGYNAWRLRFSPSHNGVVHAPLRVRTDEDAGSR